MLLKIFFVPVSTVRICLLSTLLCLGTTVFANAPIRYKLIVAEVRRLLDHPVVSETNDFVDEANDIAELLLQVHKLAKFNEPSIRSESAFSSFLKKYVESAAPLVSLEAKFDALTKLFTSIDLSSVHAIRFENLQVADFRDMEPHVLNQEVSTRIAELENLRIIGEQLQELLASLKSAKQDINMVQRLLALGAKALIEVQQTSPKYNFVNSVLKNYLFDLWWDWDISYPKLAGKCRQALKVKEDEINELLKFKLRPGYQLYGQQMAELVQLQAQMIKKRKEELERRKKELEKKAEELKAVEKELAIDKERIDQNEKIILHATDQIARYSGIIDQLRRQQATNSNKLKIFQSPDYNEENYKNCPDLFSFSKCSVHDDLKAAFLKKKQQDISSLESAIQQSNREMAANASLIEQHQQNRTIAQRQNESLVPKWEKGRQHLLDEQAVLQKKARAFASSLWASLVDYFSQANESAAIQLQSFLLFTISF
jgi:hypothetical protein